MAEEYFLQTALLTTFSIVTNTYEAAGNVRRGNIQVQGLRELL